jgi:hypothetical protein
LLKGDFFKAGFASSGRSVNAVSGGEGEALAAESGGQTFYKRVAGWNFMPLASTTTFVGLNPGCMARIDNTGLGTFVYDLQLPNGANLDYLSLYYFDQSPQKITVSILAFDGTGGSTTVDTLESAGSGGYGATGSDVFSHIVDNYSESLLIQAEIPQSGSTLQLCGVRVRYQFDISSNYLPAMLNSAVP